MQIHATPIESADAQQRAIMRLRDVLDPAQRGANWSHQGEAVNAGVRCKWEMSGGKLNLSLSLDDQTRGALKCTIQIGSFNRNRLGLLALDERGRTLLCRQRLPNEERSRSQFGLSFFANGADLELDQFSVSRSGRSRTYFVLACVDDTAAEIVGELRAILHAAASNGNARSDNRIGLPAVRISLPPVGTLFASRRELFDAGVHRALQAGIVGAVSDGAESIVLSGGYSDDQDSGDEIVYTGEGGRDSKTGRQIADQEFNGHNQSLVTSCLQGLPVRVIRSVRHESPHSPNAGYRYDGLWRVEDYWRSPGLQGFLVCQYRLVPLEDLASSAQSSSSEATPAPRTLSTISRLIRDTEVSRLVKRLHGFRCQVCGIRLECEGGPYAEAAHIRPLGAPHHGPDVPSNVLCLCPNCHVMFDRGAILISDDFNLIGTESALRCLPSHSIDATQIEYHRRIWGRA